MNMHNKSVMLTTYGRVDVYTACSKHAQQNSHVYDLTHADMSHSDCRHIACGACIKCCSSFQAALQLNKFAWTELYLVVPTAPQEIVYLNIHACMLISAITPFYKCNARAK